MYRRQGDAPLRKLVEYMAQGLVEQPDAVQVREGRSDRYFAAFHLTVAPEDFGKVIGRQGRVAKAMRSILRAAGARQGKNIALEIHEQPTAGESSAP
jgi:predicted RNA-binding protein YlqC (UPF0109 family)